MSEVQWMKAVCDRLNEYLKREYSDRHIEAQTDRRLAYSFEIESYGGNEEPRARDPDYYRTDLLIFEINSNKSWIPRVVIEGKLKNLSTHDALTYSAKAATHAQVHPYLRYGILIAELPSVPWRLFRHGSHFDFMITWKGEQANTDEWDGFQTMISEEIKWSEQLQSLIETRSKSRPRVVRRMLSVQE
ncbi:MAG: hypothetical protein WBB34_11345 [Xanthobacteraceae bacterium]